MEEKGCRIKEAGDLCSAGAASPSRQAPCLCSLQHQELFARLEQKTQPWQACGLSQLPSPAETSSERDKLVSAVAGDASRTWLRTSHRRLGLPHSSIHLLDAFSHSQPALEIAPREDNGEGKCEKHATLHSCPTFPESIESPFCPSFLSAFITAFASVQPEDPFSGWSWALACLWDSLGAMRDGWVEWLCSKPWESPRVLLLPWAVHLCHHMG